MKSFTDYLTEIGEVGYVEKVYSSLVYVSGLPKAEAQEIILFETGENGMVFGLAQDLLEILLFSKKPLSVGTKAVRTGHFLAVPIGQELLGQNIGPLGRQLNPKKPYQVPKFQRPISSDPLGISHRSKITKAFDTGNSLVDFLIPLGCGQRELVIGDRKTGKTNFLLNAVANQAKKGIVCVYASIGKKKIDIAKVDEFFVQQGFVENTVHVSTSSSDTAGLIFLTPFSAMSIAEYFKEQGREVFIVFDDLTTHAKYYREISLLAKRFPGRNSYPGDIFYTHARLLERAGNFIYNNSVVSITCLCVAETIEGDLSGYVQTNLMAMTDGHIFFDNDLFTQGRRPAINAFLSVTRVGRQTQTEVLKHINREIMSFLSLYDRMQRFIHFGAEATQSIKHTLENGEKILTFFQITSDSIVEVDLQIFLYGLLWVGLWQSNDRLQMQTEMNKIIQLYETKLTFRTQVQNLSRKSVSFNEILGILQKNMPLYLKMLGRTL